MLEIGEWTYLAQRERTAAPAGARTSGERSFADSVLEKIGREREEKSPEELMKEYDEYRRRQRYLDELEEERRLEYKRKKKKEAQKRLLKEQMKKAFLKKKLLQRDSYRRVLNKVLAKRAMLGKENYREFLMKGARANKKQFPELPHTTGVSAEEIFSMFCLNGPL